MTSQRIVWMCLTILCGWRLKGELFFPISSITDVCKDPTYTSITSDSVAQNYNSKSISIHAWRDSCILDNPTVL